MLGAMRNVRMFASILGGVPHGFDVRSRSPSAAVRLPRPGARPAPKRAPPRESPLALLLRRAPQWLQPPQPPLMRVLVVYSHPVETSFNASLHRDVVDRLRAAGHDVDDCDLYAEDFDPVMRRAERLGYHDVPHNREPVREHVERLLRAEAIVFCFP